ncbi:hypothetical protein [Paenibacillus sp. R14(2021)]|uniref:hypothetical protein n=1 Tax=Paenibacillus sp. R14(2021) TaxID=2859228 RepID=UPI001C615132|nr:hypothetical protein [Paenibacillus sp. R14(2021)]
MHSGKALRLVLVGLVFAVVAIGFLPFLVIYSWSDLYGLTDADSPAFPLGLLQKLFK